MAEIKKTVVDTVATTDAIGRGLVKSITRSDAIVVAEQLTRITLFERQLSDNVSAPDELIEVSTLALSILEAHALSASRVRVTFDAPALNNAALSTPSNYVFDNVSAGTVDVTPLSVFVPPGQSSYVEIDTSEHTGAGSYQVALTTAIRGAAGEYGDEVPYSYVGIGTPPELAVVIATSPTAAEVHFTEAVADNVAVRNTANYKWTGGLQTVAVVNVIGEVVTLQTTEQAPGTLYTLTVLGGDLAFVTSETVAVSDAIAIALTTFLLLRTSADSVEAADSLSTELIPSGFVFDRVVADAMATTDALQLAVALTIQVNDAIATTDSAIAVGSFVYEVVAADSVAVTDVVLDIAGTIGLAINESYSFELTASGAVAPLTWSIYDGALPNGLTLSGASIAGKVPLGTAEGDYTVKVQCVDALGRVLIRKCTIGLGHYISLLHMNGTAGSTVFRDEKRKKTWAANGNAQLVADAQAFGGIAANFDGFQDWIQTADHPDFFLNLNDWTIECFLTLPGNVLSGNFPGVIGQRTNATSNSFTVFLIPATNQVYLGLNNSGGTFGSSINLVANVRTHVAITRRGGRVFMHINGAPAGSIAFASAVIDHGAVVRVGAFEWSGSYLNGRIDELRFVVGGARYNEAVAFSTAAVVESDYSELDPYLADSLTVNDSLVIE